MSFELPAPPAPVEAALAAAFAILLFRYNGQPGVQLDVSRVSRADGVRWRRTVRLQMAMEASASNIVAQAARGLSGAAEAPALGDRQPDDSRAAIVFMEPDGADAAGATIPSEAASLQGTGGEWHLHLVPGCRGVRASLEYDETVFTRAPMERAGSHLERVLVRLCEDPDTPIARIPLLSADERRMIECACDGRPSASPLDPVHKTFEAHAAAAPETIAVRFRDQSLTYGELNCRANALACRLVAEGVDAESRVAVCLPPSLDLPVALLATLKAGGAYVPLDPTHPELRLRALLGDIRPTALVTNTDLVQKLGAAPPALLVDEVGALTAGLSGENLDRPVCPEQTASIYFTSGTTGAPKGAMASHANLAAYLAMARQRYAIGRTDVMPAIARFSFSISMFELMSPLCAGGTLLVLDREHILDMERMSKTLEQVTIFHAGPSLLKNVVAHIKRRYSDVAPFAGVRHASSGGDMVPPELLESLKEIFSRAEVFVIYGCTEVSCMGCTYPVPRDRAVNRTYVGRPFDGTSVRVLDEARNLLPAGIVGDIWFAGDGIVKGYLNRPELTSERFVDIDGRRFYRTGDMGRLSEDGWIELVGRSDFQIKLRGIRVEIAEVEHCLRRADGVRDAVVMPTTVGTEKGLVAYVVMDGDGSSGPDALAIDAIREHMARHLPEYMLPAVYVRLDALPLNHNMKVDRNALPPPDLARQTRPERRGRPPRSESEKGLAAIWARLLGVDEVGLDDRFFDMGGDSLRGLEFASEVARALGVELNGLDVVRETLEGLAAICDTRLGRAPAFVDTGQAAQTMSPEAAVEVFHFGHAGELYGVLSASSCINAQQAVLICSPPGLDGFRSHFIQQRLAVRLASAGIPSLRFDFYGCGDSMGDSRSAGCDRWRRDIRDAYCEMKRRAGTARITAVAIRLAAPIVAEALRGFDVSALVVWDPVCDGRTYYAETMAAHEQFVGSWRRLFRPPAPVAGGVELLGWTCPEATVREIQSLVFPAPSEPPLPMRWLITGTDAGRRRPCDAPARDGQGWDVQTLEWDPGWNDILRMDDMLPDVGVSAALSGMIVER